jgi:hypothetical protein
MANKKAKKDRKPAKSQKGREPAKKQSPVAELTDEELDGVAGGALATFTSVTTAVWSTSTLSSTELTTSPTLDATSLTNIWISKR